MKESESIKEIVNQVSMQANTVVMMAFRDTETRLWPATTQNQLETQSKKNGRLILEKPRLKWDTLDGYVKLLNYLTVSDKYIEIQGL